MRYALSRMMAAAAPRPAEPVRVVVEAVDHDEAACAVWSWARASGRELLGVRFEPAANGEPRTVEIERCDICESRYGERHPCGCGVVVCGARACQSAHDEAHRRAARGRVDDGA